MKVYSYLRVSTDKQDVASQRLVVERYLEQHALTLDQEIAIDISSWASMDARQITNLLATVRHDDVVVVSELSRLARSVSELSTIADFIIKKKKANLVAIKNNLILDSSSGITGTVMLTAFALAAEIEREMIRERTKAGMARVKSEGRRLGARLDTLQKNRETLSKRAQEHAEGMKSTLLHLIGRGFTQREIATWLNDCNRKTVQGRDWNLCSVQRLLKRLNLTTNKS